jgi:predicted permease
MPPAVIRDVAQDAARAWRLLWRRPGFAAVAIATLALGIGAPAAVFSVVRAVLLRPLPYAEPDRIVTFRMESNSHAGPVWFDALPVDRAARWGQDSGTLSGLTIFRPGAMTLLTPGGPHRLTGVAATANLFEVLRVSPAIGSTFTAIRSETRQVVLSHLAWRRFFDGDRSIVGQYINLDGQLYAVTGVMPERFEFPDPEAAYWVPLPVDSGGSRGLLLPAVARLRPGVTIDAVVREGRSQLMAAGDGEQDAILIARTLQEQMVGAVRPILWMLMGAVSLVFVIAAVNIALLLLTRGAGREREFAIRLALGAGRLRLARQLFVEAGLLAALGGAAGLLVAFGGLELLLTIAPPDLPRLQDTRVDAGVLAFTMAVVALTSLIFGALSAGRSLTLDPARALTRAGGESRLVARAVSRRRLNVLAGSELAITVVLLAGAGLLLRSLMALVAVDPGFDPRHAVALQITLPVARYPTPAARLAFHERLLERLTSVDGIAHAGLITTMPNRQPSGRFDFNPGATPDILALQIAEVRAASEGFLEAMGIPLVAGRTFRAEDDATGERVVVISRQLAAVHFPDGRAVGEMLYSTDGVRRVIGVVGDVKPATERPQVAPAAYLAIRQEPGILEWFAGITVVLRGPPSARSAESLRALILSLDPAMPPYNVRTLEDEVSGLVVGPRFSATVLAIFATVALVMASLGVYGVMAYTAGQRTREIGLRIALGATRAQVVRLMLRDGVAVVAGGVAAGLLAAFWGGRLAVGRLQAIAPADPALLAAVAGLLGSIGLLAAYVPARRATRVTACRALRDE